MSIPSKSFKVRQGGRWAQLRLRNLPIPDTFFYSNNVSVAAEIDVDVTWRATAAPTTRGEGTSVPSDSPNAYLGEMQDASCNGKAKARETGFHAETGPLSEAGFFAQMGHSRNGVFL